MMQVTEAIKILQEILETYGDLDIFDGSDGEVYRIFVKDDGYALPNGEVSYKKFVRIRAA